jgi:hypothetical protein
MTRIPRLSLILVIAVALALASVPFASAGPLTTSPAVERTVGGWVGAAVRWLEDLAGHQRSGSGRAASSSASNQKERSATGGSCLDPYGHPRPGCL